MKAIVYGNGSFAEYVSYVISAETGYDVVAYCVDTAFIGPITELNGLPIVPFESVERYFSPLEHEMFIAVGDNEVREEKFHQAIDKGFSLLSCISPKADTWSDLKWGQNVFLSSECAVQPFVSIADNTILIGAKIGHHSTIGKNNLLSGCSLAGNVKTGNNCFLGLNAAIKQGVCIGNNNIIGMGCAIVNDTSDHEVYRNHSTVKSVVPATRLKKKYLK
jgi:sugar O-acyltransferase (sialic acid O-acetyltransferase NeuD family)